MAAHLRRAAVRSLVLLGVLATFLAVATSAQADPSMTKLSNVTVVASDGTNLVGDVYLPGAGVGRYPAVVDMEPYGRSTSTQYVGDGFARINMDVRGSGMSGGALCLLCLREQEDVYDVVEWVAHQPWSNGKVALWGYSYSAITSLLGAALQPPNLDAVVVGHPPTDPYRDVVWQNGMFDQGFVDQWMIGQTALQSVGIGYQPQILDRAQQEFAIEAREEPLDGPLYYERSVLAKMSHITVPVYIWSGWEDNYSRGDLWLIDGLASRYKALYIDASTHHGTGEAGEVGAPYGGSLSQQLASSGSLNATPPNNEDQAWLDHFLKGVDNGIQNLPRVRYLDLGDGSWHSASSWQSVTSRVVPLFLSGQHSGSATLSPNDGSLVPQIPTGLASAQDMYVYTPTAGASEPIGKEGPDGFEPYAPLDQRVDEPQGLTYTTPAFTQPFPLAGPSEFHFWAITEASDMDWVARLIDVAPDGSTRLITQGWLRASFRYWDPALSRPGSPYLPDDRLEPVTVGLPIEYRMDVWDTAYTLEPGHRLRLWLSSSDTPSHEPLPEAGRNLILHSSDYPSQLLLGTRLPSDGATPALAEPAACTASRRLRLSIGAVHGAPAVRVRVYVDGHLRLTRRGRRITSVTLTRPPGRGLVARIVRINARGRSVTSMRTLTGCAAPRAARAKPKARRRPARSHKRAGGRRSAR